MVTVADKLARFLGTLMIAGSLAGVLLSLVSIAALALLGAEAAPLVLSTDGWWAGDYAALKFLVGLGILLLGVTPVIMLAVLLARAFAQRLWDTVLTATGLLLVLGLGLYQVFG